MVDDFYFDYNEGNGSGYDDLQFGEDEYLERYLQADRMAKLLTPIFITIILLIGLPGNIMVIYVTIKTKRVINHPVNSMLVLNLAVADLIYLISSAPYQAIVYSVETWCFGDLLCPVLHYLNIQTMAVSIFTMCSLATMRFVVLMMPFKVQRSFVTRSGYITAIFIIIIVWVLATALAMPNAINYKLRNVTYDEHNDTAETWLVCAWPSTDQENEFKFALFVITFAIPLCLVAVLYFFIGREVFCYMKTKNAAIEPHDQSDYKRTTMMVFLLVVAFLVCWLPYHLHFFIMIATNKTRHLYMLARLVSNLMGECFSYAHACINPIIYTFATPGFRKSICKSIRPDRCHDLKRSLKARKETNRLAVAYTVGECHGPRNVAPPDPARLSRISQGSSSGGTVVTTPGLSLSESLLNNVCANESSKSLLSEERG